MRILSRYIIRESITFFGIALFAFTSILLTIRMLHFASLIVDKGVAFGQICQVFIAIIPTFLEIAIPLSTLLGIMLAFARLSGDSEIVVMRTSGVSLYQIVRPILVFGIAAGLVGLYVSHHLKPWGYRKLSQTLFEIAKSKSTSGLDEGVFNKLGALTIYAEKINDTNGELSKVVIDDRRDKKNRKIVFSKSGAVVSNEKNQTIILKLRDGCIHEQNDSKYILTNFVTNNLTLDPNDLFASDVKTHGKQANEMSTTELEDSIAFYSRLLPTVQSNRGIKEEDFPSDMPTYLSPNDYTLESFKKKILRLKTELGQRYSLPFASFALALIALPLGVQPPRTQRTWGAGLSATLGMVVFVIYYGLFSVGVVLAQSELVPPVVALWAPNFFVFFTALYMIQKTASEKWQSIAHGFEEMISFFYGLFHLRAKT